MGSKNNLEAMSLRELRVLRAECREDLNMFLNDMKMFRQAFPGRMTMYEEMCHNATQTEDLPEPTVLRDSNKIKDKHLLHLLQVHTGVRVSEIFLNAVTADDNDGSENFRYNVKCSVDKIQLELSFLSSAKFTEDPFANIDDPYALSDLKISVLSAKYKLELQKTVEFFTAKPAWLGAFFLCAQEFYQLFHIRRQVVKKLLAGNQDYISVSLATDTGYYVIECNGVHVDTVFFVVVWGLGFDHRSCSVQDSFKISVHEDEQLLSDVNPLFNKLCKKDGELKEDVKLELLTNVMIAVKAADTKFEALSTVSTELLSTSQVQSPKEKDSK